MYRFILRYSRYFEYFTYFIIFKPAKLFFSRKFIILRGNYRRSHVTSINVFISMLNKFTIRILSLKKKYLYWLKDLQQVEIIQLLSHQIVENFLKSSYWDELFRDYALNFGWTSNKAFFLLETCSVYNPKRILFPIFLI